MANRCHVCNKSGQTGRHYGAITCYPCRAFFRRAQSNKRERRCKGSGNCILDGDLKKFCNLCRYQKCISIGMRPEYVLDEEGISQRFKYAKGRPARRPSEQVDPEASSSSDHQAPSPQASPTVPEDNGSSSGSQEPVITFRLERGASQEPVFDFRRKEEEVSLSPEQPSLGSLRATPSPGRGWFPPVTGSGPPIINPLEVGRWPTVHQSPRRSFHSSEASVSPRPDWFSPPSQSLNSSFGRAGVSLVGGAEWYPPPPETIIKEEVDQVSPQPIRVSVIRSNPNTPIKVETPAPSGSENTSRVPFGLEQEDFVLPAPIPLIHHPFYPGFNAPPPHQASPFLERSYSSFSGVGLPMAGDLSSSLSRTQAQQAIIRMMSYRQTTNQDDVMKYSPVQQIDHPVADHMLDSSIKLIDNRTEESRFEVIELDATKTPEDDSLSEDLIGHYLHKKFRKHDLEDPQTDKEVTGVVSTIPLYNIQQIKTDMEMDVGKCESYSHSPRSIASLMYEPGIIDTRELDHMFIDDMEKVFFKAWRQVNIGEFVMQEYIHFCVAAAAERKVSLDPLFFTAANMQFREKFLNFIVSYDVIDLPYKKLYNVIKKNLTTAQSLIYVFQFNQPDWEKELRLGSGDLDWEQWQNRPDKNLKGVQFSQMMHHIKLPDSSKMDLLSCLLQMCLPIMQDTKVFILTFLLGLFNNETDQDVVRLREMFESILVKYLLYNYKKFSKMNEMKNVKMVVDQLENLSKMVK